MASQPRLSARRHGSAKTAALIIAVLLAVTGCQVMTPKPVEPAKPGDVWRSVLNLRTIRHVRGVAWSESLSRFVAVGDDGTILHSPDGDRWSETASGATSETLLAVAWSESLSRFVATGFGDAIVHSADGDGWSVSGNMRGDIRSSDFRDVTWSHSLSLYVAVGNIKVIVHSTDGSNWSAAEPVDHGSGPPGYGGGTLSSVAWSEPLARFVAVGNGFILHSDDGDTWSVVAPSSGASRFLWGVTAGGSRFVAVGPRGTVVHSDDGDTWSAAASVGTPAELFDVAWSDSLARFVAAGDGSIVASP